MDEASKTNIVRGEYFKQKYFSGRVIDIGCGSDLVTPNAVAFDTEQGNAQFILDCFAPETFDCVHSSHCLEHMSDVEAALNGWWTLVKPGGYLIVVVPHEDLYEQGVWPSLFNPDHKATFRLGRAQSWSPVSFDIVALIQNLQDAEIIDSCVQDEGYKYQYLRLPIGAIGLFLFEFAKHRRRALEKFSRRGLPVDRLNAFFDYFERLLSKPVDQTMDTALAQIQVIARKAR